MSYETLLSIHLLSVVVLLGIGGGSAFYKFMADRSKNVDVIVHTNRLVVLADWIFTTPAIIMQPLSGLWLMESTGYTLESMWLSMSIALYAFSTALWLVAVYLQMRMKTLSIQAQKENKKLDKRYTKLVRYWIGLGVFSALAMGIVFYLMVLKV